MDPAWYVVRGVYLGNSNRRRGWEQIFEEGRRRTVPLFRQLIWSLSTLLYVLICRQHAQTSKTRSRFDGRPCFRISDNLRTEENLNRSRDEVRAWWEVYDGVFVCCTVAAFSAAATIRYGLSNRFRVVLPKSQNLQ